MVLNIFKAIQIKLPEIVFIYLFIHLFFKH